MAHSQRVPWPTGRARLYPADWSPVCGDQVALYNEMLKEFHELGAELIGISVDGAWCHAAFARDRKLHCPLLADFEPKGDVTRRLRYWSTEITNAHFAGKFSQSSEKFSAGSGMIFVLHFGIFRSQTSTRMPSMQPKLPENREVFGQCTKHFSQIKTRSMTSRSQNMQPRLGWTKRVSFRK